MPEWSYKWYVDLETDQQIGVNFGVIFTLSMIGYLMLRAMFTIFCVEFNLI